MRTTKIVATLGPSSDSKETIARLMDAGVDVFRLNASHGTQEEHVRRMQIVRELSKEKGRHVALLLDLQGPKIRLGKFEGGKAYLETGSSFEITTEEVLGNTSKASTVYPNFARDVKPFDRVLLADGAVELKVISTNGVSAKMEVVAGGWIGDRKGINLPGVNVSTPSLTRKDMADLQFGLDHGIDFVALSFVRKPSDVVRLKLFLEEREKVVPVVAKIEKPEACEQLDQILAESDGVMVARGDLGVEVALEKVPAIQKTIIEKARAQGKFVITATQMLESMIENPVPTRAEVSDIANAIFDGTDAVMLSAETSAGKFPVESVRMMARIAGEAQSSIKSKSLSFNVASQSTSEIMADAAYHAAQSAEVSAIVVLTTTGTTARMVARFRPRLPIFALTTSDVAARQLSMIYGVRPILAPAYGSTEESLQEIDKVLVEGGHLQRGDMIVLLAGQPMWRPGTTNMLILHRLGDHHG